MFDSINDLDQPLQTKK